jgi:glycosyltransferase involved in cell wall biosynthesis
VLFIGRLDPEKGVRILLEAWKKMKIPLIIRGDGKLDHESREFIKNENIDSINMVERLSKEELDLLEINARFLIWPSQGYYETFGMVAIECFAHGIPVVASNIGVMREIVTNNETGLLFDPGDPDDLASKVEWLWHHPDESKRMGLNARKEFEEKYTAERNFQMLIDIYSSLLSKKNE